MSASVEELMLQLSEEPPSISLTVKFAVPVPSTYTVMLLQTAVGSVVS